MKNDIVKGLCPESNQATGLFLNRKNENEEKLLNTLKNLVKKHIKDLKSLDKIDWDLSVIVTKQGTEIPVLCKGNSPTNLFMNKNSLDFMEAYYVDKILGILQQAGSMNLSISEFKN